LLALSITCFPFFSVGGVDFVTLAERLTKLRGIGWIVLVVPLPFFHDSELTISSKRSACELIDFFDRKVAQLRSWSAKKTARKGMINNNAASEYHTSYLVF